MVRHPEDDPTSSKTFGQKISDIMQGRTRRKFTNTTRPDEDQGMQPGAVGLVGQDRGYPMRKLEANDPRLVVLTDRAIADALGVRVGFVKRLVEMGRVPAWHGPAPSFAWRSYNAGWSNIPGQMRVTPVRWWIPRHAVRAIASLVTRADQKLAPARLTPNKDKQDAAAERRARRAQRVTTGMVKRG